MWKYLKGKKTYVACVVALVALWGGMITGDVEMELADAIEKTVALILVGTIRHGISRAGEW
jgi:hypothetical protein